MKLFFNLNVRLGAITFDFLICLIVIFLFYKDWHKIKHGKFPLLKSFVLYGWGYIITCLVPEFAPNFIPRIIVLILLFSYVYYYCLDSVKNIKFAIVCYALFAIIMCGNGLLEPVFGINPLDDYLQSVSDNEQSIFMDNSLIRMGQKRYRSFIPHPISFGVACCVILYLLLWSIFQLSKNRTILLCISIGFLLSGVIISGSRSPVLGLIPVLYFFLSGHFFSQKKMFLLLVLGAFLLVKGDYLIFLLDSVINSQSVEDSSGSSTEMRLRQYSIAWDYFSSSPIWGMGMYFNAFRYNRDILGAESVWLPLMMNNGIIGVFSYAIVYWGLFRVSCKSEGRPFLIVIIAGWLIMRTATSLIGVGDAQFFTVYFCIYRYYEIKKYITIKRYEQREYENNIVNHSSSV